MKSDVVPAVHDDPWLSNVLGRDALRIDARARSGDLAPLAGRLSTEALFVTAKVPANEPALAHDLESMGFRIVDTALTFRCTQPVGEQPAAARFARPEDQGRVVEIARSAFKYSRFHLDPAFPAELANRIKAEWAANYFSGQRGNAMIVIETDRQVAGFLMLLNGAGHTVVVDLIAVDPAFARSGHARSMIAFAANQGTGSGPSPTGMLVGTQAANTPSVNLYEALGFRLEASNFVLHHHGVRASYSQSSTAP